MKKKEFIKGLSCIIDDSGSGQETGVVKIDKTTLHLLLNNAYLEKMQGMRNTFYIMKMEGTKLRFALFEVAEGCFKVVLESDTPIIDKHRWYYYRRDALMQNKSPNGRWNLICLERLILDYHKYGAGEIKDSREHVHHMWYRWCAVYGMIRSYDRATHKALHKIAGNFSRSMCIRLCNETNYLLFARELEKEYGCLRTKIFCHDF